MNDIDKSCQHCHKPLYGPICAYCGQKADLQLAVKPIVTDFITKTSELDFRFFRAVKALLTRPGDMIKEYLNGHRIIYPNPIKTLFIITTLYALIIITFNIRIDIGGSSNNAASITLFINYLIFAFLALSTFAFQWLFKKFGMNWAKSFIVLCFCWSGYLLIVIALALVSLALPAIKFEITRMVVAPIYLFWVCKFLFELTLWQALWRTLVFYIAYFLSSMLVMTLIIASAHLLQFKPLML